MRQVQLSIDLDSLVDTAYEFINNPIFKNYGLVGLGINGIFSPVLPFPPEITASALILGGQSSSIVTLVLAGSWILGSVLWYYGGLFGYGIIGMRALGSNNKARKVVTRHHNNSEHATSDEKAVRLVAKYGWVIILISPWIPILGDLIPLIAGIKKYNFKHYLIAISVGKIIRAVAIVFFSSWFFASFP